MNRSVRFCVTSESNCRRQSSVARSPSNLCLTSLIGNDVSERTDRKDKSENFDSSKYNFTRELILIIFSPLCRVGIRPCFYCRRQKGTEIELSEENSAPCELRIGPVCSCGKKRSPKKPPIFSGINILYYLGKQNVFKGWITSIVGHQTDPSYLKFIVYVSDQKRFFQKIDLWTTMRLALDNGLVPVIHGDVVFDQVWLILYTSVS